MAATMTTIPTSDASPVPALWRSGIKAGVTAAVATTAVAAVASAGGVSFESAPGDAIPLAGFAQLTLFFTAIGVLIARVIRSRAARPRATFTKIAVALTVLSVVPDLAVSFDRASRLTLVLTHLVAAAIVIPTLRARLSDAS